MKYYAIKPDTITTDWSVCESLVKGVKGAQYKSFKIAVFLGCRAGAENLF